MGVVVVVVESSTYQLIVLAGNLVCILVLSSNRNDLDLKPSFTNLLICLVWYSKGLVFGL